MSWHTPGPWLREGSFIYALMPAGIGRNGAELFKNRFWASVTCSFEVSEEEIEANARLIAAAPELLEACKRAFDQTDKGARPADWEMLRAAIAKAKGAEK